MKAFIAFLLVLALAASAVADKPLRTRKSPDGSTWYDVLPQGCYVVRDTLYGLSLDTLTFLTDQGAEFLGVYIKPADGPSQTAMARDSLSILGRELPSYTTCDTPVGSLITPVRLLDASGVEQAVLSWTSGRLYRVQTFAPNYCNAYQFLLRGSSADTILYDFYFLQGKVGANVPR